MNSWKESYSCQKRNLKLNSLPDEKKLFLHFIRVVPYRNTWIYILHDDAAMDI